MAEIKERYSKTKKKFTYTVSIRIKGCPPVNKTFDRKTDAVEWAKKAVALGAGEILLTSMDADGTKNGYDIELTKAISSAVNVPVIASGGAGKLEDFYEVLTEGGADAVLAASVFHYKTFTIREVKEYLQSRGIEVRL